jgi:spore coat polysaccharide biosynthesis predicted glycosyltransferase SpsG
MNRLQWWADCGPGVGLGHVMRSLAIAEAVARAGGPRATFLLPEAEPAAVEAVTRRGFSFRPVAGGAFEADASPRVLGVDSYRLSEAMWMSARQWARRLFAIVDLPIGLPVEPDLVLNYNVGGTRFQMGNGAATPRWLEGVAFAPLREEFRAPRERIRDATPPRRVLISLGGSGDTAATLAVLEGLAPFQVEARVLAREPQLLEAQAPRGFRALSIEPLAPSLREPLEWADLAVLGAGSARYEAAFLGTPALLVILADNQEVGREAYEATGCARFLGRATELTSTMVQTTFEELNAEPKMLARMSRRGQELVDGRGADRVASELIALLG